jgi:RHS repeat-associated protein
MRIDYFEEPTFQQHGTLSVLPEACALGTVYAYSPYGEATALGPDGGNSLQYTGRENDETGLHYYRARYYDRVLKRFVSEDPIGIGAGLNGYAYVQGNPVARTDPSGLRDIVVAIWTSRLLGYFGGDGSVGHVFVGELNGAPILSQFPSPHGVEGSNNTLSWRDTLAKEGRQADFVYQVTVPNDAAFDTVAATMRAASTWYFWPNGSTSTQCASAAAAALRAGGVQGLSTSNPSLPNHLNTSLYVKSLLGSDAKRLQGVPW